MERTESVAAFLKQAGNNFVRDILLYLFICSSWMYSLSANAQVIRPIRQLSALLMPGKNGENGGTVALNQKNRYYYATIAGNKTFPLAIFNASGERISPPELTLIYDLRGLWYQPATKTFHGNGFGNNGWCRYVLDEAGIPYDVAPLFEGQRQPFVQSVGAFSQKENIVYFLKGCAAIAYDAATGMELPDRNKVFKIGYTVKQPPPADYRIDTFKVLPGYNTTTLVFTGVGNAEFGLLNVEKKEIELYSASTGLLTQRLQLPKEAVVKDRLNFAFCNGLYWLYDAAKRSWIGYR